MARNRNGQPSRIIEVSFSWILQDPGLSSYIVKCFVARYEGVGGYVGASTAMTSHRGSAVMYTPPRALTLTLRSKDILSERSVAVTFSTEVYIYLL